MENSELESDIVDNGVVNKLSNEIDRLGLNENVVEKVEVKKKRKKKKKPVAENKSVEEEYVPDLPIHSIQQQDNSHLRKVFNWPAVDKSKQTFPPTVPVNKIYKKNEYPEGEKIDYTGTNSYRTSSQELKNIEENYVPDYSSLRRAAEVHKQVRKYMQSVVKPGIKLMDLCNTLEEKTKELVSADGLNSGWGFPTGCSLNHCAAHYTPNPGDNTVLTENDICKLDFGVQVNGMIIDCAFSIAFKDYFDPLIQSTIDGTNTGLKLAGIDAIFSEISSGIQEAIESYEFEYKGRTYPIKAIKNLNGHSILPYQIHGGKSLPIVATTDNTRMEENEVYAIETFASTGRGYVTEGFDCSHYMKCYDNPFISESGLRLKSARTLLTGINNHFGTLAFCRKWLEQLGFEKHALALKYLVDAEIVRPYPPLNDVVGSFTSQTEHTVILRPTCKEVVSRGYDF